MIKPKARILALTFGLILPYVALATYFALRIQEHPVPTWFPYFGLSYILGTIILVIVFSRRISRDVQAETAAKSRPVVLWLGRAWSAYLLVIWSGLFLWGAYQTISGNLEWHRALPAGAFLLAFIALLSWSLYKDIKRPTQQMPSTKARSANNV